MELSGTTYKIIVTFLLLFTGLMISRVGARIINDIHRKRNGVTITQSNISRRFQYITMAITIIVALVYLQVDVVKDLFGIYHLLPKIISFLLLIVLGVLAINFVVTLFENFFRGTGMMEMLIEYEKEKLLDVLLIVLRVLLYFLMLIMLLNFLSVNVIFFTSFFNAIVYGTMAVIFLLIYSSLKLFFENYTAGIYVNMSSRFKLGQKIKVGTNTGHIHEMTSQGVIIKSDEGLSIFIPHKRFVDETIISKNVEVDFRSLDKMQANFVAQIPSYCGPASAAMILKFFGFDFSQDQIGYKAHTKKGVGTHPKTLIDVVEELTEKKVIGAWITADKITDLKQEIRSWLRDDGLIIVDYKKGILFPEAKKAHYSVCVAIEGDEVVIIDPSQHTKTGGVYLVDHRKLFEAIDTYSELIRGKRGYIVLAREGTTAHHRIKNGVLYADPTIYKKVTKKLQKEITKLSKSETLELVLPSFVRSSLRKLKEKEKVTRVWNA